MRCHGFVRFNFIYRLPVVQGRDLWLHPFQVDVITHPCTNYNESLSWIPSIVELLYPTLLSQLCSWRNTIAGWANPAKIDLRFRLKWFIRSVIVYIFQQFYTSIVTIIWELLYVQLGTAIGSPILVATSWTNFWYVIYHDDVINGNIFRVTGLLWGEFTGHLWIPFTRPVTRSFDAFFDLRLN